MSLFITEFGNVQRLMRAGININPTPIRSYNLTSAASTTPSPGTQYLRVSADAASFLGITTSTASSLTSTNAFRVPANSPPELFAVGSTAQFIMGAST